MYDYAIRSHVLFITHPDDIKDRHRLCVLRLLRLHDNNFIFIDRVILILPYGNELSRYENTPN